jgi:hypothetical protein
VTRSLGLVALAAAAIIAAWRFGLAAEMGASAKLQLAHNQARAIELEAWGDDDERGTVH